MRVLRSLTLGLVLVALAVGCAAKEPRKPQAVYDDSISLTNEMTGLVEQMHTLSAFREDRGKLATLLRMLGDLSVEFHRLKDVPPATEAKLVARDEASRERFAAALRRVEPVVRVALEKMLAEERARVRAEATRPPKPAAAS